MYDWMCTVFFLHLRSSYNGHPPHMKCCELRGGQLMIVRWREQSYTRGTTTLQRVQLRTTRELHSKRPHSLKIYFSSLDFKVVLIDKLTQYWSDTHTRTPWRPLSRRSKVVWEELLPTAGAHDDNMRLFQVSSGPRFLVSVFLLPLCNRMWLTRVWRTCELMWYMYCI